MRRILAVMIATSVALQPLAAAAGTAVPYYRTKPVSGEASATLGPIAGPVPIRTHVQTLVDAVYSVSGASNPQWSATGLPSGLSMSPGGIVSGTVPVTGTYQATISVAADGASESETVPVEVYGNLAVALPQTDQARLTVPSTLTAPTVTGDPIAPVTFEVQGGTLPPGMTLDGTTGVVSGTPTAAGSYTYGILATDASGADAVSNTETVYVSDSYKLSMASVVGRVGQALASAAPTVSGTPYGALSYSLSGTLPAGLSFSQSTGAITGTPTAPTAGDAAVAMTLTGLDATGKPQQAPFTLQVSAPLAFAAGTTQAALVMRIGQYATLPAMTVAHNPVLPGKWAIASGTLPAGVLLNANTGVFYGTPDGPVSTTTFTMSFTDGNGLTATSGATKFKVIDAVTIAKPGDASADTGQQLYAPTPVVQGKTTGTLTWSLVDDGPGLAQAAQYAAQPVPVATDPLPAGVAIDATTGQVSGTSELGSISTAHYELADQSGAPPVDSATFHVSFLTDFKVGQVAGIVTRIGDTDHTVAPTVTNTRTGQSLASDAITWSPVCTGSTGDYGLSGISLDPATGIVGGTAGYPSKDQGMSDGFQLYAVDAYHTPTSGGVGARCPSYGDLATNAFTISVLYPLQMADVLLGSHVGLPVSLAPLVRNQATYPITWSLSSGALPAGLTLAAATVDYTYPAIYGSVAVPTDATFALHGEDSSFHEASVDGTGHDFVTANVRVQVTPEPTLGTVANETGRTLVGHTVSAPAVSGTVVGAQHWTLASGAGLLIDASGNPTGLALDASTGIVSGVPTTPVHASVTLHFVDDAGGPGVDAQPYRVDILPALVIDNPAPVVAGALAFDTHTGTASVPTSPSIENGPTGTVTWTLNGVSPMPAGLSFNTFTGVLSGTPTDTSNVNGTTFPDAYLSVVDQASPVPATAVSKPFALNVFPALAVATTPDVNYIRVGDAFSMAAPAVSNGPVSPLVWVFQANAANGNTLNTALPAGLSMDADGNVAGTPTTAMSAPVGHFAFKVTDATNAVGLQASPFLFDVEPPLVADAPADLVTYVGGQPSTPPFYADNSPTGPPTPHLTVHNKPVGRLAFSLKGGGTLPGNLSLDTSTGAISGTPAAVAPKAAFQVHVADQSLAGDTADTPAFNVTVQPPMTLAATSPDVTLRVGVAGSYVPAQPANPVGTPTFVASAKLPGMVLNAATGALAGMPSGPMTATAVTFAVTDQGVPPQSGSTTANLTVLSPLAIEALATQPAGRVGTAYKYAGPLVADNVQVGHPVTWAYAPNSGIPGLVVDPSTGALTGTPTTTGTFPLSLIVSDDLGAKSLATTAQQVLIRQPLSESNVTTSNGTTVTTTTLALNVQGSVPAPTVSGSPTLPLTYSAISGLPTGMTIDPGTGTVFGMPTVSGTYTVYVQVQDYDGSTAVTGENVLVTPPSAAQARLVTHMGTRTTVPAQATFGNPAFPVTWTLITGTSGQGSAASTLPQGMAFKPDGTLSGTAATAGVYALQATASDANGNALVGPDGSTTTLSWTVEVRPQLTISTVQNGVLRALVAGKVVQAPSVAGNPLLPLAFTISGDKLPSKLSFSATLGTVSGTPANADVGVYNEQVTVTDATGVSVTSPAFNVTVTAGLVATAPSAVTVHVGQAPNAASTPGVQNSVGTPSWALASGTLPVGLSVDPGTGALTGKAIVTGSASVTVTVTDPSDGSTATTPVYGVTVNPSFVASAPTLSSQGHPGYAVTGRPSVDSSASGTVTWAFSAATNVPTGFSVASATGILSTATAGATGTYPIAETATDGTGQTGDTPSFNVSVVPPVSLTTPFNASRPKVALSTSSPLLLRYGINATTSVTGTFGLANAIGAPSFSMSAAPAGLALSSTTGVLSGAPTSGASVASGNLSVTGSDSSPSGAVAGSGQATLSVPFSYYGSALGLTAYGNGSYFNGDAVSVAAPAQSGSPLNGVLALNTLSGALPAGLVFNSDGSITGSAGAGGSGAFTVTLTDDTGGTYTTPQFTLAVSSAALASVAYPSSFANASGTTPVGSLAALYDGSAVTSSSLATTKANGIVLTFAANVAWDGSVDTDLPSGTYAVEYNAGTQASPSWTTYASGTVASTQFRISGTAAATPARFRLGYKSAFPHLLPSLTATKVWPSVGTAYSATLDTLLSTTNATGVENWTLVSGTVPPGMTLDTQGGTLTGTPTAFGDVTLSLAVKDADGVPSVPVNLVISVQSNLQASAVYPTSALDVGSGATPVNTYYVADGTKATSVPLAVAAGYDASAATGPTALAVGYDHCPAAGGYCVLNTEYGSSYWSGAQYTFTQAVSWDGSVDLATTGSPSTTVYYNSGTLSSPKWTVYSASLGPVTTTGVQVVASGGSPVQVTKARLGFGSAYPAYLPSTTAASAVALQGGTVSLDTVMSPINVASGSTEAWASTSLPAGVTVSGSTLQVASSTVAGTYSVPFTVADARGLASAPSTLTLTVDAPPTLAVSSATATYGTAYTGTLNTVMGAANVASGATWTVTGAPTGYAVSGTGTAATLAVTAANQATTGSYPVTVKVVNTDGGTASATLTLSVAPGLSAATVTTTSGTAYSGSLVSPMSATGPSLSWAVGTSGNTLPTGVAVSSTGTLTVAATVAAGTYSAPVTVTSNSQTAMATLTVTVSSGNPANGLVAYWKLDERSGTTAADATVNGYTLTATGASPFPGAGEINGGAAMNGSTSASSPSLSTTPTGVAARTISTWFKTSTTSGYQVLMGYGGSFASGNIFELCLNGSTAGTCGNGITNIMPSASYGDGNWHMLTATYDGTNSKVYLDGSLQATQAITMATTASPVMLGNEYARGGLYYTGSLDEAGLWNRALSAAEVTQLYNSGNGKQGTGFAGYGATLYPATVTIPNGTAYSGNLATIMNGGVNATKATYAVTSGSLPGGLTLSSAGVLSGTTTAAGNYTPTITATNSDGTTSSAMLTIQASSLTTGLVGYWKLDERSGTTALDATGNGYTLTASGSSPFPSSGLINGAAGFTGSNYMTGQFSQLTGATSKTSSIWFKASSAASTNMKFMSWGTNTTSGEYDLGIYNSTLGFFGNGNDLTISSSAYLDGNWHMVTATYDGTTETLYVDGVNRGSAAKTLVTGSSALSVGTQTSVTSYTFTGSLDEAGVWNRALTAAEVSSLYNSGTGLQGLIFASYGATLYPATVTIPNGTAYSGSLPSIMNGGVNATRATYAVTAGSLPTGVTLSSAGVLSGTTTVGGNYAPTITATNPDGTTSSATLTIQSSTLATGLIGYWKLDEMAGTTALDSSGYAHTLTASGTSPFPSTGEINGGGNFTGSNYLSGSWGLLTGASPRTMSAWFKTTTTAPGGANGGGMLMSWGNSANGSRSDIAVSNGGIGLYPYGSYVSTPISTSDYANGAWHMVTVTYDGATASVFLDGVSKASGAITLGTASTGISFGTDTTLTYPFSGSLDEAAVWNRALGAAEVTSLYNSGNGRQGPAFAGYGAVLTSTPLGGFTGTTMSSNLASLMNNGVNGTKATWTAASLPSGLSLSSAGILSGTPGAAGSFTPTITATTPDGIANTATLSLTIGLPGLLPTTSDQPLSIAFTQNVATLMLPSATATWSASGLPSGVALSSTGMLSGTLASAGSTTVTVTATPSSGSAVTGTLTLNAVAQGGLTLASASLQLTTTSQIYGDNGYTSTGYGTAAANGIDLVTTMSLTGATSATFTSTGSLPPGVSMSTAGVLTGTPTTAGNYVTTITATSGPLSASAPLYTSVVSTALTADKVYPNVSYDGSSGGGIALANAYDGVESTSTGTVTSSYGLGLGYNQPVLTDGSLKVTSGITASAYDKTNGTAAGVLVAGSVLSKAFTIRPSIAASFGTAMLGYQGRFPTPLPSISASSLLIATNVSTSVALDQAMSAVNVQGSEGWALASGTLPTGMSMTASGSLYGSPTTAGTFTPAFTVKDSRGIPSIQQTLTITVATTLQTGLLAYLKLDEGAGSTAYDSVSGNQATFSGSPIWTAAGAVNGAATFNGASQVSEPFGKLTGNVARTMNVWFKTTSTAVADIMEWGASATSQISDLGINSSGIGFLGYGNNLVVPASTYADGRWHMLTASYDSNTMTLYLDGTSKASQALSLATANSALSLGNNNYVGSLDEPAVWGRALTAAEVSTLYNAGAGKQGPYSASLSNGTATATFASAYSGPLTTALSGSNVQNAAWAVSSGSLPTGMTVSNTGVLSGTPTQAGSYPVTVTATNPDGSVASATLTVAVSFTSSTFDGSTSYVSLPAGILSGLYTGSTFNGYTVEGWANFSNSGAWGRIMDVGSTVNVNTNDICFGRDSSMATYFGSPGGGTVPVTGGALTNGTWTHVAMTQMGATMTLYVNGVQVSQTTSATIPANASRPVASLGKSIFTADAMFAGQMADVQVYDRALSAAEIASTKKGGTATGIVARYLTTAVQGLDATGNGNTGAGTGAFTTSTFLPN